MIRRSKRKPNKRKGEYWGKYEMAPAFRKPDGSIQPAMRIPVICIPATESVKLKGSLLYALKANMKQSVGCTISHMANDQRDAFLPVKVVYVPCISPSRAMVPIELDENGQPFICLVYGHHESELVKCNDSGELKKMIEKDPTIMDRTITLGIPYSGAPKPHTPADNIRKSSGTKARNAKKAAGTLKVTDNAEYYRGALSRAVSGGLISESLADMLATT